MKKEKSTSEVIGGCLGLLVVSLLLDLVIAWGVQGLWNWLIPLIFHLPMLTYWQSLGLVVLIGLIASPFRASSKS